MNDLQALNECGHAKRYEYGKSQCALCEIQRLERDLLFKDTALWWGVADVSDQAQAAGIEYPDICMARGVYDLCKGTLLPFFTAALPYLPHAPEEMTQFEYDGTTVVLKLHPSFDDPPSLVFWTPEELARHEAEPF